MGDRGCITSVSLLQFIRWPLALQTQTHEQDRAIFRDWSAVIKLMWLVDKTKNSKRSLAQVWNSCIDMTSPFSFKRQIDWHRNWVIIRKLPVKCGIVTRHCMAAQMFNGHHLRGRAWICQWMDYDSHTSRLYIAPFSFSVCLFSVSVPLVVLSDWLVLIFKVYLFYILSDYNQILHCY